MSEVVINKKNFKVNELSDFLVSQIPTFSKVNITKDYVDIIREKVKIRLIIQGNNIIIKPKKNIFLFLLIFALIVLPLMILQDNLTRNGIWIGAIFIFALYGIAFFLVKLILNAINKNKANQEAMFIKEIKNILEFNDMKNPKDKESEMKKSEPIITNKEEEKAKNIPPKNQNDYKNNIVNDYEEHRSDLKKLFDNNLLTQEEYDEKVYIIQMEIKQKEEEEKRKLEQEEAENRKIIFKQRLEKKTKPLIELLINAKDKKLITETEYKNKEKEIIEKYKKEVECEDSNRPQVSQIPIEILNLFSEGNKNKLINLLKEIEFGDKIVLKSDYLYRFRDSRIKIDEIGKYNQEQWKKIIDSQEQEKYVIIIDFNEKYIFIINDKTPLLNMVDKKNIKFNNNSKAFEQP